MRSKIKAAVFPPAGGQGGCSIQDVVLADPSPHEVIIQVKACGICHTDAAIAYTLENPGVLGHEASGIVSELGSGVSDFAVGDRVLASFGFCGTCENCNGGDPAYCLDHIDINFGGTRLNGEPSLRTLDGDQLYSAFFQQSGFAEYALCQENNLVHIPDELSFEMAAPLGCGIQTGAGTILTALGIKKGQSVVIFGLGAVGLAAVMAAKYRECAPIIAVDFQPDRLALAKEFGAHYVLTADTADLVDEIKSLTGGGAHFSVEASGAEAAYHTAINCLRPKGTCGTLTHPGGWGEGVRHPGGYAFMDTRSIGIIEGDSVPREFIPKLIEMHLSGDLPYDRIIKTYPFSQINDAFTAMHDKSTVKPVIVFP